MVEYGSGLFNSTTRRRFPSASQFTSSSILQILGIPSELDIGPPLISQKLKLSHHMDKDVILLSEFSEIEGPIPLLCIPEQVPSDLDLNEFSLQLMSTDYQNMGICSGTFHVSKDTCLLQEDDSTGHYFYVHYFTLYDVRARGFVRPMCLSYLTKESQKLRKYFKDIQKDFMKATEYLKISNLEMFCKEMKLRIGDLHFTKMRYIQAHKHFPRDDYQVITLSDDAVVEKKFLKTKKKQFYAVGGETSMSADFTKEMREAVDETVVPSNLVMEYKNSVKQILSKLSPAKDNIYPPQIQSQLHSSSPSEHSRLSSQIRSEFQPDLLNFLPGSKTNYKPYTFKGSRFLKETVIESSYSSDSSTTTIKSSSHDFFGPKLSYLLQNESGDQNLSASDECSVLQHTSLDALAAQLLDCENILEVTEDYLDSSTVRNEIKEFLDEVMLNPQSPLCLALLEQNLIKLTENDYDHSAAHPSIFVTALMYRNLKNMRQIKHLCGIGYVAALATLLRTRDQFSKNTLTLHFEKLDKEIKVDPLSSLFIGKIPVINFGNYTPSFENQKYIRLADVNYDKVIKFLSLDLSKVLTPDLEYIDALDTVSPQDVTFGIDCLEELSIEADFNSKNETTNVFHEEMLNPPDPSNFVKIKDGKHPTIPLCSTSSDGSWSSSTTKEFNFIDQIDKELEEGVDDIDFEANVSNFKNIISYQDIDERMENCEMFHLSAVLQQFSGVSQCIIQSVLSGKPMIIAGPDYLKSVVILYTKALSTILPCSSNSLPLILKWHTGTITNYHISSFKIIGTCIPERLHVQDLMSMTTLNQVTVLNIETGHISGVAYSGSLLHNGDQLSRRHFKSDVTLQVALQAILVRLGMKAFLLYHLRNSTSKSDYEILKGIGIPRGDWTIIQYLANIVEDQIKENGKS